MRGAGADMLRFVRKPTERMFWLFVHLEKFIASYVAVWTAFSVATLSRGLPLRRTRNLVVAVDRGRSRNRRDGILTDRHKYPSGEPGRVSPQRI